MQLSTNATLLLATILVSLAVGNARRRVRYIEKGSRRQGIHGHPHGVNTHVRSSNAIPQTIHGFLRENIRIANSNEAMTSHDIDKLIKHNQPIRHNTAKKRENVHNEMYSDSEYESELNNAVDNDDGGNNDDNNEFKNLDSQIINSEPKSRRKLHHENIKSRDHANNHDVTIPGNTIEVDGHELEFDGHNLHEIEEKNQEDVTKSSKGNYGDDVSSRNYNDDAALRNAQSDGGDAPLHTTTLNFVDGSHNIDDGQTHHDDGHTHNDNVQTHNNNQITNHPGIVHHRHHVTHYYDAPARYEMHTAPQHLNVHVHEYHQVGK